MENSSRPPRRKRYKGTHPRAFAEKYKEHAPSKYADDVEKIIGKGYTPAGMHRPICVEEILSCLKLSPGMKGMDATLGYGGHSREILKCILPGGILYATDVDPYELPRTAARLAEEGYGDDVLKIRQMNFAGIDQVAAEAGLLDFVVADLGVSSMQIDNPERGFSLKTDGPLDLRLNPLKGKPASAFLEKLSAENLEEIFIVNADEPHAGTIANAIAFELRNGKKFDTTLQLKNCIAGALNFLPAHVREEQIKKSWQRCFQALRIEVNDEFEVLEKFLEKLPDVLAPGARVAILSFHSGEDRRVKKSFQRYFREGIYSEVAPDPIRPSVNEIAGNPRARSAKMRWAIRNSE
jgi:16S rRNA (cytosine1402-N4)-methyltransferase